MESAIELAPERKDFHENVAKLYDANQNPDMASRHRKVIEQIEAWEAKNKALQAAAEAAKQVEAPPPAETATQAEGTDNLPAETAVPTRQHS